MYSISQDSDNSDISDGRTNIPDSHQTALKRPSRAGKTSSKSSGACVHCKSLKVRCEFSPNETVCQRCQAGNYECKARSRKKRKPAPTHEDLQEKAHDQDRQIEILLAQFDQMRNKCKIQALMDDADYHRPRNPDFGRSVNASPEMTVVSYFSRGQYLGQMSVPSIVHGCSLYPAEIMNLFAIFFERINPFFSILDPDLHRNPANVIWASPFLFTVICATASRLYTLRPKLYPMAHAFARDAAGVALTDGSMGVDICQAYLILAVYPVPKKKFVDDRSWLFMGIAIRMAIELGLNQPPPPLCDERESLNRTRTWLNCYCVDASHAIQFGKMPMLGLDDYVARSSQDWYKSSKLNGPFDVHLCAYVNIILLMAEWRRTAEKGKKKLDIIASAVQTQNKLSLELTHWVLRFEQELTIHPLPICTYRGNTTRMITAYLRLVILADGFQHSVKKGLSRGSDILRLSIDAARTVIQIALEKLYPTGNLRFAMDANFLYVSFAAAFLVNLLRPRFLPLVTEAVQRDIVRLVSRLVNILGSDSVALDGRHTPALYSRFLSSLLAKYNVFPVRDDSPPTDDVKFYPQFASSSDRTTTPPHVYSWPDVVAPHGDISPLPSEGSDDFMIYERSGDPDIDLSLSHFIRTVGEQSSGNDYEQRIPGWDPVWNMNGRGYA
ncbi:fungal-specific transcription factor domain-containing protein [Mycena maculata]|uniref:Fungal-specific transcription factor domain-containing protein n=1 Tax=Mycena maculata TaxID=230809 RepID=A0AAD7IEU6_9AGAR|nr:fungal-specific transcription factor domain-containing protein [Mycena maculata]